MNLKKGIYIFIKRYNKKQQKLPLQNNPGGGVVSTPPVSGNQYAGQNRINEFQKLSLIDSFIQLYSACKL